MARWLKQSTSVDVPVGPFVDATDGFTAETALTITQPDVRLRKNAVAWAQKAAAQTLTHDENGYYTVTLDATDTNTLGMLMLAISEGGARPVMAQFLVVPANIWDSFFSTDYLQVDSTQLLGTVYATPTVAGVQEVDITHFNGTAGTFSAGRPEVNTTHAAGTAWSSGAITAASLSTGAAEEIADTVWDEDATAHQTQGTFGQAIGDPGAVTSTIHGKTSNLTFTVANQVDANMQSINDTLLVGNGSSTPWGP